MNGKEVDVLRQGLMRRQLDYILVREKWRNSALDMEPYNTFIGLGYENASYSESPKATSYHRQARLYISTQDNGEFFACSEKKTEKHSRARVRWDVPFNYLGPFTVLYVVLKSEQLRANQI